jgi:hypothetical protein
MKRPKITIRQTVWGNWYGYIGGKKVIDFMNTSTAGQEEQAIAWKKQQEGAAALTCDWAVRRAHADHYVFEPCGRPGEICTGGPACQRGSVRCTRHKKA